MIVEQWAVSDSGREVAVDEALAVLGRDETWEPSQQMFSLVATDCGREVYGGHGERRRLHYAGFNY